MKPNIVWYDIPALELDRAIQFYSAVLAAPVKKEVVGEVPTGWLAFHPTVCPVSTPLLEVVRPFGAAELRVRPL